MKQILLVLLMVFYTVVQAKAQQHQADSMNMPGMKMETEAKKKAKRKSVPGTTNHGHQGKHEDRKLSLSKDTLAAQQNMDGRKMGNMPMEAMNHSLSRNLPMNRNGSGTGWSSDDAPMYMYMLHAKKWTYMLHGNFFIRYNHQDVSQKGYRGDEQWDAPNMLMAMGQRPIGEKGLFHFSAMFSLDALFTGQHGYPLLFQSGESANGTPLVDRQHPHDLFSALEMSYAYSFNKKSDAYLYVGYPGEPALGATTFMHRASGMDNPDAPLSHHWVDATHITFGVATLGYRYGKVKIEGSLFTGREPDENRYNFDKPRFDSRSVRLWYNPDKHWSAQVSHGFIKSPEALHPDENVYRTTASVSYSMAFGKERFLNVTGLWGMNKQKERNGENAVLVEASLRLQRLVIYSRYEWVQKSVEELNLDEAIYGTNAIFPVNELTVGAGYDILYRSPVRLSLGMQGTLYAADGRLDGLYGRHPMAAEVYIRFYPPLMKRMM